MKKINQILLSIIIIITTSCSRNEGKFTVSNESDFNIDSLVIIPNSETKTLSLNKGEKANYNILMNSAKSDGSYWIFYKKSGTYQNVFQKFGYYTNGNQIEDVINIRILNDTILIDSK